MIVNPQKCWFQANQHARRLELRISDEFIVVIRSIILRVDFKICNEPSAVFPNGLNKHACVNLQSKRNSSAGSTEYVLVNGMFL